MKQFVQIRDNEGVKQVGPYEFQADELKKFESELRRHAEHGQPKVGSYNCTDMDGKPHSLVLVLEEVIGIT